LSTAIVFPGQGAQYVGMGLGWYEGNEKANAVFSKAVDILGPKFKEVMFTGPEEELKKTDYTQPAILVHSAMVYEVIKEKLEGEVVMFAGHSLGEYSALFASGALSLDMAIKMVQLRGQLMQDASTKTESLMAAVMGLSKEQVEELCEKTEGYIALANINSPVQIVVSGEKAAIDNAESIAKEMGAKRYIKLAVAGAFHSEIMRSAADGLAAKMNEFEVGDAQKPVVANVTAQEVTDSTDIKELLVRQIVSPVRWVETVEYMKSKGITKFVEAGPGAVLSGLIKKLDRSLECVNIDKFEDLEKL
jgi:[acyl-carrier-protein] S-malonyltransferase